MGLSHSSSVRSSMVKPSSTMRPAIGLEEASGTRLAWPGISIAINGIVSVGRTGDQTAEMFFEVFVRSPA
jgi:hypothetical protein